MAEQPWTESEVAQNFEFQQQLAQGTRTAFVTPVLVALNVAVYLGMVASGLSFMDPTIDGLLKWGADFGPYVTHGQWWRLVTSMFIHIGIIHIGMNMFILWNVGKFTERLFGNFGFFVLYMLAGIGGSLTSVWWKPFTVSAGASGAVFGVYGGLLGYLLIERQTVPQRSVKALASNAGTFIIYNLIYSVMSPNTDMAAHVGGFLTGFVLGCALARPLVPANVGARLVRSLLVLVVSLALAGAVFTRIPVVDDLKGEADKLDALETSTLATYNDAIRKVKADEMTPQAFSDLVEQKLIPPWNAERDRISRLRIAGTQEDFVQKLVHYMSLRSDAWKYTAKGIRTNNKELIELGNSTQEEAMALLKDPNALKDPRK